MQMKVEIDVTDRLAEILRAAIVALGSPLVSVAASAPEQADSPNPEERERRYETPVSPPPPPPPPAEGKRGRGRPRKDEQPPAEQPPAEQPPAEGIDPNELWARAKLVAGSGKEHAQAVRDMLAAMNVARLSAVPASHYSVFGEHLDRIYDGEPIPQVLEAFIELVAR